MGTTKIITKLVIILYMFCSYNVQLPSYEAQESCSINKNQLIYFLKANVSMTQVNEEKRKLQYEKELKSATAKLPAQAEHETQLKEVQLKLEKKVKYLQKST